MEFTINCVQGLHNFITAMRWTVLTLFLVVAATTSLGTYFWYRTKLATPASAGLRSEKSSKINNTETEKLKAEATGLRQFTRSHYNHDICFLVDMSFSSGRKRFFVYNLKKDSIEIAGMVSHGSGCDVGTGGALRFSNQPNSYCSSLGRYRVGNAYYGRFGLAFRLYGLDQSNSNAYLRYVVLHAHPCVPDEEVAPYHICKSLGCPMVSETFLLKLKEYISKSGKPIVLKILE